MFIIREVAFFTMVYAFACVHFFPHASSGEIGVTVGYFPNITHAHALIAQNMATEGKPWFEPRLPEGIKLQWQSFNAGPSAMESMFAGATEITYVGPSPVLNAFVRSKGGVRVVSGAMRGGAGLVAVKGSEMNAPQDFKGKRIATPQLGNTQDVACRYWLSQAGLRVTLSGGDALVIPTPNASILPLFLNNGVDAAWTVEPWLSRLELDAEARLVMVEPPETCITTVLAVRTDFEEEFPELVGAFVKAHQDLTTWIENNPEEAKKRVAAELTRQMRREFPAEIVEHAWPRLVFSDIISGADFQFSLDAAQSAGFLKGEHSVDGLVAEF